MLNKIICLNGDEFIGTNLVEGAVFTTLDLTVGGQLTLPTEEVAHTSLVSEGPSVKVASVEPQTGSKKERAIALFKDSILLSRQAIINLFMTDLGMTKAGASTYYAMCKKVA